tara:strand:+ start:1051 stop:1299 length:249 start_codon:yes stop_codon:yes gene_type:complete
MLISNILRRGDKYVTLLGKDANVRLTYSAWQSFLSKSGKVYLPFKLKVSEKCLKQQEEADYISISDAKDIEHFATRIDEGGD